jgi:hypothetical protein
MSNLCLAERRGAKILFIGPSGVSKTSQLRSLERPSEIIND